MLTGARELYWELEKLLEQFYAQSFGRDVLSAVSIQQLQLQARLRAFADWQSEWRKAGWEIAHVEVKPPGRALVLPTEKGELIVSGRIDRIDVNTRTGDAIVFDYKTGDKEKIPEKVHRKKIGNEWEWIDLQLPAYYFMATNSALTARPPKVGYVSLSSDGVREEIADWTEEELSGANRKMLEIASAIHAEIFWPPSDSSSPSDPFAQICGTGIRSPDEEEEESE